MPGTYKKIEVVGTSPIGFDEAVQAAITAAGQTVRRLDWFEVVEQRGNIKDNKVAEYQVVLKLGWGNSSANLYLTALAPNGTVIAADHSSNKPKKISFVAPASGTYTAVVRAKRGRSSYTLSVAVTTNDPPVASADSASTAQATAVVIHPLATAPASPPVPSCAGTARTVRRPSSPPSS